VTASDFQSDQSGTEPLEERLRVLQQEHDALELALSTVPPAPVWAVAVSTILLLIGCIFLPFCSAIAGVVFAFLNPP
jgi:hypothetical protein